MVKPKIIKNIYPNFRGTLGVFFGVYSDGHLISDGQRCTRAALIWQLGTVRNLTLKTES
jgi:hypothetical protein